MDDAVTFFNIIRVPDGKAGKTLAAWRAISDLMERSEGCLSTKLHQNRQTPSLLINYARFSDTESFFRLSQTTAFLELSQRLTDLGVEREAGVYDVLHSFGT